MYVGGAVAVIEQEIASDAAKARVVFSARGALDGPTHVTLIFNFFDELRRMAPTERR